VQAVLEGALSLEGIRKASLANVHVGYRGLGAQQAGGLAEMSLAHAAIFLGGMVIDPPRGVPDLRPSVLTRTEKQLLGAVAVRVHHRCCSGTKLPPSVHLSTRQGHFGAIHR